MVSQLTVSQSQFKEAVEIYHNKDALEHVLLDERNERGEITTILEYDDEHILIQKVCGFDVDYNIVSNADFFSGKRVTSH